MDVLWMRTVQAGQLLPGDLVRQNGNRHAVIAALLVPHQVTPAVEVVLRDTSGSDKRLLLDAYLPVAVLEVA